VSLALLVAVLASGSAEGCGRTETVGAVDGDEVPSRLIPIYQGAAAKYALGPKGPAILAGINWEETGFGTNLGDSSVGAEGWMQFLPESWASFGVDANQDGIKDPSNPEDAIYAAARLLRYLGAPGNWHDAIFGYNHAEWYVEDVLADAAKFEGAGSVAVSTGAACMAPAGDASVVLRRTLVAAEQEAAKQTPYVWGGFDPENGFDCSGGVSWVLGIGGFFSGRTDTQGLAVWGHPGPGSWITVYIKTTGSAEEEHTAIEIAGVLFESGGGDENENPAGGWGKVDPHDAASFLEQFDTERHPAGY